MSHSGFRKIGTPLFLSILLVAVTWAVFGQTLSHGFVNYDDGAVYQNPRITNGLTLRGLAWATTHAYANNWHPLTSVSHMFDCQIYGLHPWGHHLTNVLLHAIAVLLCFFVLWQMTGALWRSAFVAALFAIHPLHVESVAWIAERKDVLSGVFFMLTLGAYLLYVRKPSFLRYLTVAALFAAGLVSKPMLVTLPLILLLLDYWPLRRFEPRSSSDAETISRHSWRRLLPPGRLMLEKLPLLALSGASCVATLLAQKEIVSSIPLRWRIENAIMSCVVYIREMIWPARLAVFYPHRKSDLQLWQVMLAAVLLCAVTFAVLRFRRKRPYFLVGWLWYLVMLLPVIGLVQVGLQSHADRYTYLPQIGLYLALTWAVADISASWRWRREILCSAATIVIAALVWCARVQTSYWRNSESLWRHALAVTPDNAIAEHNLGFALAEKGEPAEAMTHLRKALEFDPNYATAHSNIAFLFTKQKRWDEAIAEYQAALRIEPDSAMTHYNLATAFLTIGKTDQAITHYQRAIDINPDYAETHIYLGNIFLKKNQPDKAIAHYQRALEIEPNQLKTRHNLALVLLQKGRIDEAIACWRKNLLIQPDNIDTRNNLAVALLRSGHPAAAISEWQTILRVRPNSVDTILSIAWVLATSPEDAVRNGPKALSLAQEAQRISFGSSPVICRTLAAALAECGRFREAISEAQRGFELATAQNKSDLERKLQNDLALYRANTPLRDTDNSCSS